MLLLHVSINGNKILAMLVWEIKSYSFIFDKVRTNDFARRRCIPNGNFWWMQWLIMSRLQNLQFCLNMWSLKWKWTTSENVLLKKEFRSITWLAKLSLWARSDNCFFEGREWPFCKRRNQVSRGLNGAQAFHIFLSSSWPWSFCLRFVNLRILQSSVIILNCLASLL